MKSICLTMSLFLVLFSSLKAQKGKIIVDNEKIRITEYTSLPGKDVCGSGMHTHTEHGNILMTDAKVNVTYPDGSTEIHVYDSKSKKLTIDKKGGKLVIPSDGAFWVNGETHELKNTGNSALVFFLIETK